MIHTRGDGQAERISNPIGTMNMILPVNVREYFLFDGEKIDNFAKPEAAGQVKQAIYLVLKLEILDRAHRHLEAAAQDYRKSLKQISGEELRSLIEQEEKARKSRDDAEDRKAELKQEIESARHKVTEISQRLLEIQGSQALQQRRDSIERERDQRRDELNSITSRIQGLATEGYFVTAQPAIKYALQLLDEKRERGEIPSNIRRQFVQDLIEQMRCICGRSLSEGSPEYHRLMDLMNSSLLGSLEDEVLDTSAALRPFASLAERQRLDLHGAMSNHANVIGLIKDLEAELDDVARQLKGSPLEEISKLEKQRQEFQADIEDYILDIGSLDERTGNFTKEIAQLENEISKARKEEKRERTLSTKLDLAQRAADAVEEMHGVFADQMRQKIEEKTQEIFKLLVWKDSHFQKITLDSDYRLEVTDRYGLPARPELSAGERQILSLSFITAMSQVTEEEAPIVMDTPFGRLSSYHRSSITRHLPELADQLVLFVTDEELRDEARENLVPFIGAEYRLEFNTQTSCTQIIEVPQ